MDQRGRSESVCSGRYTVGGNGLMLLYEAAMLLEQRDSVARFPPTTMLARPIMPMQLRLKLAYSSAGLRQQKQQQEPLLKQRLAPISASAMQSGTRRQIQDTSRSSHNELEKNRRAHLRQCLDCLRDQLPLSQGQAGRLTMLNVLNKSLGYIRELECKADGQRERIRAAEKRRQELLRRRAYLWRVRRHLRRRAESARAAAAAAAAAAAEEAWRSRNASEISAASASSEDSSAAVKGQLIGSRLQVAEDSPDSGYDSPQNCCRPLIVAAAAAGTAR
ncbi:hypothetical protein BOX15_Mlig031557g1 [Macrostomum lignano]|uniref:BHLH domain-containing protein n=1 Tax=Macrostomum lignano TaxID=282301 RepID=A0A267G5I1_9PLAT|nr:hypothetical protein BOX15_Mlig031557g1 [Macrostomum lignano]